MKNIVTSFINDNIEWEMCSFTGVLGGERNYTLLSWILVFQIRKFNILVLNINSLGPENNRSRMPSFVITIWELDQPHFQLPEDSDFWEGCWQQNELHNGDKVFPVAMALVPHVHSLREETFASGSKQQNSSISTCNFRKRRNAVLSLALQTWLQSYGNMKTGHWLFVEREKKESTNTECVSLPYYFDSWNDLEELLILRHL